MANETTSLFGSLPESQTNDGKIILHTNAGASQSTLTLSEIISESGGGGGASGGNPYTKVTVTAGTAYRNGRTQWCRVEAWGADDYATDAFDQDVTIANNTYSIVSGFIGYEDRSDTDIWGVPQYSTYGNAYQLDTLKIKLPANTEFPMAVVEFEVGSSDNYEDTASLENIEVYVGTTKLTRLYDHPYFAKTVVASRQSDNSLMLNSDITQIDTMYKASLKGSSLSENHLDLYSGDIDNGHGIKVQVHIFGNGFRVQVSDPAYVS